MKKYVSILMVAIVLATIVTSCKKSSDDSGSTPVVASLIDTITFNAPAWSGGIENWQFNYDATTKKVLNFNDIWAGALDKKLNYGYTTNLLTLTKASDNSVYGTYTLNAQNLVVGNPDNETFVYDVNGYMTQYNYYSGGVNYLGIQAVITNGNVTQWTKYNSSNVATQIKNFYYTVADNVNNLYQANPIDNDWKPIGGFYGKPSAKLVDYFEYWDPSVTPIVKYKSSFKYTFDAQNRVSMAVKTLSSDNSTETWKYTYYN